MVFVSLKVVKFQPNTNIMLHNYRSLSALVILLSAYMPLNAMPNTLPGASSFIEIPRTCDAYTIRYAPHDEKDADGDILTYIFTFSNPNFTFTINDTGHTGEFRVPANLLAPHTSLTVTGKTTDGIDSVDFTNSVMIVTYNAMPPEFTIGDIVKSGTNYLINYSPHVDTDNDMDPVTYIFTITGQGGFSKTFTDAAHTGSFAIPASQFLPHTTYTVNGKSYDGIDYAFALNSKEFSTPNSLPPTPQILSPREGERVTASTGIVSISYKIETVDHDGDLVVSHLSVKGPGLDTSLILSILPGYVIIPRQRFASSQTYTIGITSTDGIDTVTGTPVHFISPNTSGMEDSDWTPSWSLYPNPSTGTINIRLADGTTPPAEAEILSSEGRLVCRIRCGQATGGTVLSVDLANLPRGLYYIRLRSLAGQEISAVKKLILTL